jgi:hypothetical protein
MRTRLVVRALVEQHSAAFTAPPRMSRLLEYRVFLALERSLRKLQINLSARIVAAQTRVGELK